MESAGKVPWLINEGPRSFDRSVAVGDDGTVGTARRRGSALTAAMHVSSVGIYEPMLVHLVSRTSSEYYGEGICHHGLLPFMLQWVVRPPRSSLDGLV